MFRGRIHNMSYEHLTINIMDGGLIDKVKWSFYVGLVKIRHPYLQNDHDHEVL
jgi:hypothetical protein